jgi:hypothetical protein
VFSTVILFIKVSDAAPLNVNDPVCVNLPVFTKVTDPLIFVSPVTVRFDDRVIVVALTEAKNTLSQEMPFVFKVVFVKQQSVEPVVTTVPAVYVSVPVLNMGESANVIVPVVLIVVLFLIHAADIDPT